MARSTGSPQHQVVSFIVSPAGEFLGMEVMVDGGVREVRFVRSVSLARDWDRPDAVDGYLLTPAGQDVLGRLSAALQGTSPARDDGEGMTPSVLHHSLQMGYSVLGTLEPELALMR